MKQKIIDFWKNSAILSQITKAENQYFRRRCENTHYTILTPNCMAGLIYSRLGEPFYSPTINTSMQNEDFIKFLSDLDYYLAQDVQEWVDDTADYPVGIIRGRTPEDDVRVNFVHYPSFSAGREKWNTRKKRIDPNNLYVIVCDIDDIYEKNYRRVGRLSAAQLERLERVPCANLALLTSHKDRTQSYAHYIKPDYGRPYPLVYMNRDALGLNGFERHFDFVGFLNHRNEPKKKVLIVNGPLQYGGSDIVAVRLQQGLNTEEFDCTYCLRYEEPGPMEPEIAATGVRILHQPDDQLSYWRSYHYYKALFAKEQFNIVHCHLPFYSGIVLAAAKRAGIPKRVAHAHFSHPLEYGHSPIKRFVANLYRRIMRHVVSATATDIIGCSQAAGEYLAGKRGFAKKGVVLNNGIDSEKYRLSDAKRAAVRRALGVEDQIVLGHIGQMYYVKNHGYLLEVFATFHRAHKNSTLLLVSDGPDRETLEQRAQDLGVRDSVQFLGFRTDIPELMMAMDCFVFPSIHEGFPLTLIEAQAAQLPCVVSNTITPTVKLTEALQFASIEAQPEEWVKKIETALRIDRHTISRDRVVEDFDIARVCKKLEQIYLRK